MRQTPKYAMIENDFIEKYNWELKAGAELPSEFHLIQLYQVSRATVRRVPLMNYIIRDILKMREGTLRQGKVIQELTSISSYTEETSARA